MGPILIIKAPLLGSVTGFCIGCHGSSGSGLLYGIGFKGFGLYRVLNGTYRFIGCICFKVSFTGF